MMVQIEDLRRSKRRETPRRRAAFRVGRLAAARLPPTASTPVASCSFSSSGEPEHLLFGTLLLLQLVITL